MEDQEQFDGLCMTILQKGQGINNFFDAFFGFLYRKTDFFADKAKSYEFVETHYKRYLSKYQEKKEKEERKKKKEEEEKNKQEKQDSQEKQATVKEITKEEFERRKMEEKMREQQGGSQVNLNPPEIKENPKEISVATTEGKKGEEKDEDKLEPGKIRPGVGHGSSTDKYSWTQHDIKEINITIPVPKEIRGRDLSIKYDNKTFSLTIKGEKEPLIQGEFCSPIKSDTLVWTLEEIKNGKAVMITFEKLDNYKWWDCLLKGEQLIDTTKINPEPSKLSDVDDPEMRATLEKMMFDTRQKSMGLPTSDDMKKNSMMQDFMKAHPEMDFSKCNFNN